MPVRRSQALESCDKSVSFRIFFGPWAMVAALHPRREVRYVSQVAGAYLARAGAGGADPSRDARKEIR
jgi:hypothetical protein